MRYQFYTVDVFTERRFGGNQLAVLPEASGLSDQQMQKIAVEFNYAETTFVLAPEDSAHTRMVRIFTPDGEVPFAGHPNVGTAFVLAARGDVAPGHGETRVIFEEKAGLVPITIRYSDGEPRSCELTAPQALSLGAEVAPAAVAECVALHADDIVTGVHPPVVASVGLPFLCVELRDANALGRSEVRLKEFKETMALGQATGLHLYTRDAAEADADLRARMYAPSFGVPEDPATGSANCAVAGLLAHHHPDASGLFSWRIAQGIEMGRPSLLEAKVDKQAGEVSRIRIGGACVSVSEGWIQVD